MQCIYVVNIFVSQEKFNKCNIAAKCYVIDCKYRQNLFAFMNLQIIIKTLVQNKFVMYKKAIIKNIMNPALSYITFKCIMYFLF